MAVELRAPQCHCLKPHYLYKGNSNSSNLHEHGKLVVCWGDEARVHCSIYQGPPAAEELAAPS